ncbi:uncharacterized protein [Euphorbia lathyris]|uniref:uncharacterized protein n=1 Tax=Euphorbia lathyris TaxID=212925 RepID=UPI0033140ECC
MDFSGNELKGRIPISISILENLERLNLSSNALTGERDSKQQPDLDLSFRVEEPTGKIPSAKITKNSEESVKSTSSFAFQVLEDERQKLGMRKIAHQFKMKYNNLYLTLIQKEAGKAGLIASVAVLVSRYYAVIISRVAADLPVCVIVLPICRHHVHVIVIVLGAAASLTISIRR